MQATAIKPVGKMQIFHLSTRQPVFMIPMTKEEENEAVTEFIEILEAGFTLQDAIAESYSDQKIDWQDSFNFIPFLKKLPAAISGSEKVLRLFNNFSEEGKNKVFAYVSENFDIADDEKELLIERTVRFLLDGIVLMNDWRTIRKSKAA